MRRFLIWIGILCALLAVMLTLLVTLQRRNPPVNQVAFVSASINMVNYYQVRVDTLARYTIKASTLGDRNRYFDPIGASNLSPDGSRVIASFYSSSRETDIQVTQMDGLRLFEIMLPGQEYAPVWSPDGAWIAFHALADNRQWAADLYRVRSDGTQVEGLTETQDISEENPVWSPDSQWLAFVQRSVMGDPYIFRMRADGSAVEQISQHAGNLPAWSPDGSKIAYSGFRGAGEIYLIDLVNNTEVQLTETPGYDTHPRWSPDGAWLSFESSLGTDTDIYIINLATGEQIEVAATSNLEDNPRWIIPPDLRWQPGYVLVIGIPGLLALAVVIQRAGQSRG